MTFKNDWEKTNQTYEIPAEVIRGMVLQAFPEKNLTSYNIIAGGCANLNIKLNINNNEEYILRVYLRDKDAVYKEQNLANILKPAIPIPEVYFIGNYNNYRFGIVEYIRGITLRELLLNHKEEVWQEAMLEVGKILAFLQQYKFPKPGFFNNELQVIEELPDLKDYVSICLKHQNIVKHLDNSKINIIKNLFNKYSHLLQKDSSPCLVHGDFDPANILVMKENNKWRVSGILDWEFAYSGDWLVDVANMLRYAHKMPKSFQQSFTRGLQSQGVILRENWQIIINLFNLGSLLDSMTRHPLEERPNIRRDICNLIEYIILNLG